VATGKSSLFFLDFPIYLQSVEIHLDTLSKWCVGVVWVAGDGGGVAAGAVAGVMFSGELKVGLPWSDSFNT
jgi:hypothetical protein